MTRFAKKKKEKKEKKIAKHGYARVLSIVRRSFRNIRWNASQRDSHKYGPVSNDREREKERKKKEQQKSNFRARRIKRKSNALARGERQVQITDWLPTEIYEIDAIKARVAEQRPVAANGFRPVHCCSFSAKIDPRPRSDDVEASPIIFSIRFGIIPRLVDDINTNWTRTEYTVSLLLILREKGSITVKSMIKNSPEKGTITKV